MAGMKISVVTVCFNSAQTIAECARSVVDQRDVDIEYIVVDGASKDNTLEQLAPFKSKIAAIVSEPDKGIYDAMNKGLALATGDYVGFLNSDDYFADETALSALVRALQQTGADATLADVEQINSERRVVRILKGRSFEPKQLRYGVCPPHPTFYARPEILRRLGGFQTDYRIAGDFDLMVRFFCLPGIRWTYVPRRLVTMRTGGASGQGLSAYMTISRELIRACRTRGLSPSYPLIYGRVMRKCVEVAMGYTQSRNRTARSFTHDRPGDG